MRSPELFTKNLEAIRAFNGQSMAEFAQEVGIAKSTLHSVRISGGNTTLDTAIRIADGLNLPLDSLIGDDYLPKKVNLVQHLLQSVDWFQYLSSSEQEDAIHHFQKILEMVCK